jgi:hypothetical protein
VLSDLASAHLLDHLRDSLFYSLAGMFLGGLEIIADRETP